MFNFQRQNSLHDRVIFENIADQYLKGDNITAYFSVPQSLKTDSNEDEIGLMRIGSTSIKECLASVPVQFELSTSSDSMVHGTATFVAANLPDTNDEFYQFWYIRSKSKNLGSSVPFQLNCTLDDMDYLCDVPIRKSKTDSLPSLSDQDTDDIVVINTIGKSCGNECLQNADRCRTLEDTNAKHLEEIARMRSQMNALTQFTIGQASKIVDLERRLIQADQLLKKSNEEKLALEQRLRDLQLTSEKYQRSAQGEIQQLKSTTTVDRELRDLKLTSEKYQRSSVNQLEDYSNRIARQQDRINELEKANQLLEERLNRRPNICDEINDDNVLRRQLKVYQKFINDLQSETSCLSDRLLSECQPKTDCDASSQSLINTDQVQKCPVCCVQFPNNFSLNQKNEHIEEHFP